MRGRRLSLFVHIVWSTFERKPLIRPDVERWLHGILVWETERLDCGVVAVGGMPDHVHVLVRLASTVSVSDLVKQLKGASSYRANRELKLSHDFRWQRSYGAFTVGPSSVDTVADYIRRQQEHHAKRSLIPSVEPGSF